MEVDELRKDISPEDIARAKSWLVLGGGRGFRLLHHDELSERYFPVRLYRRRLALRQLEYPRYDDLVVTLRYYYFLFLSLRYHRTR